MVRLARAKESDKIAGREVSENTDIRVMTLANHMTPFPHVSRNDSSNGG